MNLRFLYLMDDEGEDDNEDDDDNFDYDNDE